MTDVPSPVPATPGPMSGLKVLDLSQIYNGPYATFLMASAGAEVIKVEPEGGESLRRRGVVGGAALPFAMLNGGKRSIVLNLKTDEGRAALEALARDADVLVENFAPGVMERLGLGADRLQAMNPRLIYASSSGFGTDGPYRAYPAMDLTMQAMCGVMSTTGFPDRPPVKAGPALCDFFAGTHLFAAISTALYDRERTGVARQVHVTMQDSVYPALASSLGMAWGMQGRDDAPPPRTGNRHGGLAEAPYNVYPTSDGWLAIICVSDAHWRNLTRVMGRAELAEDPRFASLQHRVDRIDEVDAMVAEWTARRPKEEAFQALMTARVPCAPVRDLEEVMDDANMHARGSLRWEEHPEFGRVVLMASPLRFTGVEARPLAPSRRLGADTEAVLAEIAARTASD